jgi:gluconate 2-dehydrogenase gamma chain
LSKHDVARRKFLAGAALGAGVVASARLMPEASAQTHAQHAATDAAASLHASSNVDGQGAFLNEADAETVAAFTERLMPGAPGKPGARDAGVLNYIDLALAAMPTFRTSTGAGSRNSIRTAARPTAGRSYGLRRSNRTK